MFKSQQYRAKAAKYGELVSGSTGSDESRKFEERQDRLASLPDDEQERADSFSLHFRKNVIILIAHHQSPWRYRGIWISAGSTEGAADTEQKSL